jgi:hypothetical protein
MSRKNKLLEDIECEGFLMPSIMTITMTGMIQFPKAL